MSETDPLQKRLILKPANHQQKGKGITGEIHTEPPRQVIRRGTRYSGGGTITTSRFDATRNDAIRTDWANREGERQKLREKVERYMRQGYQVEPQILRALDISPDEKK